MPSPFSEECLYNAYVSLQKSIRLTRARSNLEREFSFWQATNVPRRNIGLRLNPIASVTAAEVRVIQQMLSHDRANFYTQANGVARDLIVHWLFNTGTPARLGAWCLDIITQDHKRNYLEATCPFVFFFSPLHYPCIAHVIRVHRHFRGKHVYERESIYFPYNSVAITAYIIYSKYTRLLVPVSVHTSLSNDTVALALRYAGPYLRPVQRYNKRYSSLNSRSCAENYLLIDDNTCFNGFPIFIILEKMNIA